MGKKAKPTYYIALEDASESAVGPQGLVEWDTAEDMALEECLARIDEGEDMTLFEIREIGRYRKQAAYRKIVG